MIKSLDFWIQTLHFAQPFKIAYEEVDRAQIVFVKIVDVGGNVGLGCASPDNEVTRETVGGVLRKLQSSFGKDFLGKKLEPPVTYHQKIQEVFSGFPSAQHAVEEAVINLYCEKNKVTLGDIIGSKSRQSVDIMFTLGILDLKNTVISAKKLFAHGCKLIKLKVGLDLVSDIERIKAVVKLLPPGAKLAIDANQGYSFKDAVTLCQRLDKKVISFIEQPTNSKNLNSLKKLHRISRIPIIADESCVSVEDAIKLLSNDIVDGVNVKLMKCGGVFNFLEIFKQAKALGKIIMIGCMYESNISITTGAQLALALPIDYVDLDSGSLDFKDDPVIGGAVVKRGRIKIYGHSRLVLA